jgi:hypothetical protein
MTTPVQEPEPVGTVPPQRQIGIWGATASGKSTFLSSLFFATARATDHVMVRGNNDPSTDFLITNTNIMANHRFPPPTVDRTALNWTLQMWVPNPGRRPLRQFLRSWPERVPFDFDIDMQDAGGLEFQSVPQGSDRIEFGSGGNGGNGENIATYLARCRGLLMLIDPLRERERGDAYSFFFGPLLRMAQTQRVAAGQRLPHYVAVCVTKFDDPVVFEFARDYGYLTYREDDEAAQPRIHPNDAERFMRHLFQGLPASDIDLILGGMRQYFWADRVKYFISSSVGFYVDPASQFREDDYKNVAQTDTGEFVIRGAVRPINVAEPLQWLGQRMAAEAQP